MQGQLISVRLQNRTGNMYNTFDAGFPSCSRPTDRKLMQQKPFRCFLDYNINITANVSGITSLTKSRELQVAKPQLLRVFP